MEALRQLHATALNEFDRRVRAVAPGQWGLDTPCTDWDVRALVNHLVSEQLWAPPLLQGLTMQDVGDRYDGDQLGDDPVQAWEDASAESKAAFAEPADLSEVRVHLSFGEATAELYLQQMIFDLAVHGWDLARAIGADERIDPPLAAAVLRSVESYAGDMASTGLFAPPVPVPDTADTQTRLLALTGRRP